MIETGIHNMCNYKDVTVIFPVFIQVLNHNDSKVTAMYRIANHACCI